MRYSFIITITLFAFAISAFTFTKKGKTVVTLDCDKIPEMNQKLVDYVKSVMNKKVARGECWDLAAQGLNKIEASWDKNFIFGKEIDPKKECVYPGDIFQFKDVKIQYQQGNTTFWEEMDQHTAIVYKVNSKEDFMMAEQNTSTLGKKVGLSKLELKNILQGSYKVFRPVK